MAARPVRTVLSAVVAAVVALAGWVAPPQAEAAAPKLTVTKVQGNLSVPWDVTWIGSLMLFDQRAGGIWSKRGSKPAKRVSMPLPRVFAHSEGGMLGLVADPKAASNKYFYTCSAVATATGKAQDIEVWKWKLASDTKATKVKRLVKGIPLSSGQHSGCRLRFRSSSMLYISTGDAMGGSNPQNLQSLGGKVLRVRSSGSIPKTNPFYKLGKNARYVWTYGHRNPQGLAFRSRSKQMWEAEHGPGRDDEVNRILKGRNYGWSPTPPGYNQARPMTDKTRYPKAYAAKWKSGTPTVATSGAAFLTGSQWQSWNGHLAVAMLKGQGVKLFTLTKAGDIIGQQTILTSYGRIRAVQQGPDGALYFTTSNATDAVKNNDAIYKVTPRR